MIQGAKYQGRLDWLAVLGRCLAEGFKTPSVDETIDALVPVPLHVSRLRARGYNQSLELARAMGHRLSRPILFNGIARVRATAAQADLSRELREKNVRRAFRVDAEVAGQRLAIIDDVMTSGATVDALARALKRAGAERVEVWVLARAG